MTQYFTALQVALLLSNLEVKRKKNGGEENRVVKSGAAHVAGISAFVRIAHPWIARALTLLNCFRGEQLGSKYTRQDLLTSGKRQKQTHNADPPAHFL